MDLEIIILHEASQTKTNIWYHLYCCLVAQLCLTLCDPMDCSLPGSSVHGILQARILEWVAISFSRGSSRPRDWTQVSRIAGRLFNLWAKLLACYRRIFYYFQWITSLKRKNRWGPRGLWRMNSFCHKGGVICCNFKDLVNANSK